MPTGCCATHEGGFAANSFDEKDLVLRLAGYLSTTGESQEDFPSIEDD